MSRTALILALALAAQASAPGQVNAQTSRPVRPRAIMPIDTWSTLAPPETPKFDIAPPKDQAEQITVFAHRRHDDAEWRADLAAQTPAYEAAGSNASLPVIPYLQYTSPGQERLMSLKTDALGLCGALGGYIQCPNLPP